MAATEDPLTADAVEPLTDTERAVFGSTPAPAVLTMISSWCRSRLGSGVAEVRFRAGRIDAVWGVALDDGREVVIKAHRPPVDVASLRPAREAQSHLRAAGFPCAAPLAGPELHRGQVLSAETLLHGSTLDGRDRAGRMLLAEGLHRHIELLRDRTELLERVGPGPSWCRYQSGPWPVPHDTIVDFSRTPTGWAWLDAFGRQAADQVLAHRDADHPALGHADWYAGNTLVDGGRLSATFDWELVADDEAVIAGFAAACFAASPTGGGGLSTPEDVAAFLIDYDAVRGSRLSGDAQRAAAGAAAWILAFNARWQVGLLRHGLADHSVIELTRDRRQDYLALAW